MKKKELDLSERQFFGVLKYIRKAFGKSSIEVGLKSALRHNKSMFADLFTIRRLELESLGGEKGEYFIVYYLDVSVFVHRFAMRCGMTSDHFRVKFGVDYGQSFLKVTLALTDASLHCADAQNASLNGGKKTMLLAVCQAPETYSLFTRLECTRR